MERPRKGDRELEEAHNGAFDRGGVKAIALTPTIGKVKDDIDRVFDRFFGAALLGEPMAPCFPLEKAELEAFVPALDMIETPKEYVVRCEVPGIHSKNLDIS